MASCRPSTSSSPSMDMSVELDHDDLLFTCPSVESAVVLESQISRESILASAKNVFSAEPSLLPGEIIVAKCINLVSTNPFLASGSVGAIASIGTLFVSNFKVSFIPQEQSSYQLEDSPSFQPEIDTPHACEVPLSAVAQLAIWAFGKRRELVRRQPVTGAIEALEVLCKDFRRLTYRVHHAPRTALEGCINAILFYGFPSNLMQLFFFDSARVIAKRNRKRPTGSGLFDSFDDWNRELARLKATKWRVTDSNAEYKISEMLPSHFCVPITLSDVQVINVAASHNLCRLPIWAWSHPETGVSLATSAVVLPGINKPDKSIEVAMSGMTDLRSTQSQVQILDLDETCSPRADLDASFAKLRQLHMPISVKDLEASDSSYLSNLEATGWLKHVKCALHVALEVTRVIFENKISVIIEEHEGRDLTCLISSLVQLLADPHYRTISGFQGLLQKCWIANGHPFYVRVTSYTSSTSTPVSPGGSPKSRRRSSFFGMKQRNSLPLSIGSKSSSAAKNDELLKPSSVLLLFLDCVWQLLEQFPSAFQFSVFYLEQIWQQVFSAQHCSFSFTGYHHLTSVLGSNEDTALIRSDLVSVWDVLKMRPLYEKLCYVNPLYRFSSMLSQSISPSMSPRHSVSLDLQTCQQTYDTVQHAMLSEQLMTACGLDPVRRTSLPDEVFLQPSLSQAAIKLWSNRYEKYVALASRPSSSYTKVLRHIDIVKSALDHHHQPSQQQLSLRSRLFPFPHPSSSSRSHSLQSTPPGSLSLSTVGDLQVETGPPSSRRGLGGGRSGSGGVLSRIVSEDYPVSVSSVDMGNSSLLDMHQQLVRSATEMSTHAECVVDEGVCDDEEERLIQARQATAHSRRVGSSVFSSQHSLGSLPSIGIDCSESSGMSDGAVTTPSSDASPSSHAGLGPCLSGRSHASLASQPSRQPTLFSQPSLNITETEEAACGGGDGGKDHVGNTVATNVSWGSCPSSVADARCSSSSCSPPPLSLSTGCALSTPAERSSSSSFSSLSFAPVHESVHSTPNHVSSSNSSSKSAHRPVHCIPSHCNSSNSNSSISPHGSVLCTPSHSYSSNSSMSACESVDVTSTLDSNSSSSSSSKSGLGSADVTPNRSSRSSKAELGSADVTPNRSSRSSKAGLGSADVTPNRSSRSSKAGLGSADVTPHRSSRSSKAGLSSADVTPHRSSRSSKAGLSSADVTPHCSSRSSKAGLSSADVTPHCSSRSSKAGLSSADVTPNRSSRSSKAGLGSADVSPNRSSSTCTCRSSSKNHGDDAMLGDNSFATGAATGAAGGDAETDSHRSPPAPGVGNAPFPADACVCVGQCLSGVTLTVNNTPASSAAAGGGGGGPGPAGVSTPAAAAAADTTDHHSATQSGAGGDGGGGNAAGLSPTLRTAAAATDHVHVTSLGHAVFSVRLHDHPVDDDDGARVLESET